jgi:hypothetical protein
MQRPCLANRLRGRTGLTNNLKLPIALKGVPKAFANQVVIVN